MELEGKNVIYVGDFTGVGTKCMEAFLRKSVKSLVIFNWMPSDEFLKYLQETYTKSYVNYVYMDLTKRDTISKAYTEAKKLIGYFDIVVNGAGIILENNVDLMVALNMTGLIHSSIEALEYMNKANGGRGGIIVNIYSIAALANYTIASVYSASKCAVINFTKSFARPVYFARTGVSFITVCPGLTVDSLASKTMVAKYSSESLDEMVVGKKQSAEALAINFMRVLQMAKNGSIWILEDDEIHEADFPTKCMPVEMKK